MKYLTASLLIAFALPSVSFAASRLSDGTYRCTISHMHLGDMEIIGNKYRGPAYDQQWGETYDFAETEQGTIDWGGPLGGISDAGKVVSTVLKNAGGGRIGYDITIQNQSGNFQTISCSPE